MGEDFPWLVAAGRENPGIGGDLPLLLELSGRTAVQPEVAVIPDIMLLSVRQKNRHRLGFDNFFDGGREKQTKACLRADRP